MYFLNLHHYFHLAENIFLLFKKKKKSMTEKPELLNQKMNQNLSRENKPKKYKPEKCKSVLKNRVLNSYQMQCTLHKLQTAY